MDAPQVTKRGRMENRLYRHIFCFLVGNLLAACSPLMAENTQAITATMAITIALPPSPTTTAIPPTATSQPTLTITPTQKPTASQAARDTAIIFIGETVPDGTNFQPGQTFKKAWTLKNGGTRTWVKGFALVKVLSTPANEGLGSPERIPLAREVKPGEGIEVGVDLVAPHQNGNYTVRYQLQDEKGTPVLDSQLWVTITVGSASSSGSVVGNVSATLTGFDQNGQSTTVHFCMTFPDSGDWWVSAGETAVILWLDQKPIASRGGGGQQKCYYFDFPVSNAEVDQAEHLSVSIQAVEENTQFLHERCEDIKPGLQARYPGLDFTCEGLHEYYSHLILPAGLTKEEANQLIVDAICNKIYGPWVLTIR